MIGEELCTALLQKYLVEECDYSDVKILTKDGIPLTPTPGTTRGKRLDRWLSATSSAGENALYQIEIKNWSAHAIGGKSFAVDASPDVLRKISNHYWRRIWNEDESRFREAAAGKVLTSMKVPRQYAHLKGNVIPLLCFWWYVTDPRSENVDPLFEYALEPPIRGFKRFQIFSVSNYLRYLRVPQSDEIDIALPQAARRIAWMKRMFGNSFLST
jgi:hypothetical protein